jgi:hypothetical protein
MPRRCSERTVTLASLPQQAAWAEVDYVRMHSDGVARRICWLAGDSGPYTVQMSARSSFQGRINGW